jgi:hypothetical protein
MRRIIITIVITAATAIGAAGTAGCSSSSGTAVLPAASCGSAVTHGVTASTQVLGLQPASSLRCFTAAARHCTHASLLVTDMGTDTGTDDLFTITTAAGAPSTCAVTEASQGYSANFGGSTSPVQTTHCTIATVARQGVTLSCAGQPILIPAAVTRLAAVTRPAS